MKRVVGVSVLAAVLGTGGCGAQPHESMEAPRISADATGTASTPVNAAPTNSAPVIIPPEKTVLAEISGQPITLEELIKPLIESRGLALLVNIAQLDLAKQSARASNVTVSQDDIKAELDLTLEKLFPEQNERDRQVALDQYLEKVNLSRTEYTTVVELNAYLRKAAAKGIKGQITDEMVEKEFGTEYGETAKCRIIVLSNMQEVRAVQDRLKKGDDFAEVARLVSRDARTAALGGELPPFSRQTQGYPDAFRQLAFALQPGQVSDALAIDTNWCLIKLEEKFPPKAVKFQNVKESLRKSMYDKLAELVMKNLHERIALQALLELRIHDPVLAKQLEAQKARSQGAIRGNDRDKLNEQWKREREAATQPTSELSGPPAPAATESAAPTTAATATQPATR